MSNALLRLRESANTFSSTEKEIARIILEDPQIVADMSVHALAKHTFSSASTIVRLCSRIGYSGYKEFRWAVTCELAQREQSRRREQKQLSRSDSLEELAEKVISRNILALEETGALLDVQVLRQCVECIRSAGTVYLFGAGPSLDAAREACVRLLQLNKRCILSEDRQIQLLQARTAGDGDAAIVICHSGSNAEIAACMKALRENRTTIIAVTRMVQSPVSELADYKLYTAANGSDLPDGTLSVRLSQLNVIDILCTALAREDAQCTADA